MFTPDSKAFWWPILHGLVAGGILFLIGWNWLDIPFGIVFGCLGGFLVWLWQRIMWDGVMRIYYTPAWLRDHPDGEGDTIEDPQPEDDHERYTGTYDETISFVNPVEDLQLYLFAKGISEGVSTVYSRWTTPQGEDPAVFNSDQFHVLRSWLIRKGYATPLAKNELDMTEYGKHFMSLISTTYIHSPTPRANVEPVRSAPFVTLR